MMTTIIASPLPIFDSLEYITDENNLSYLTDDYDRDDIKMAVAFLKSYRGSQGTFNSYRREIERFIHWCALVEHKPIKAIKRDRIESFVEFSQKPPKNWIGILSTNQFSI